MPVSGSFDLGHVWPWREFAVGQSMFGVAAVAARQWVRLGPGLLVDSAVLT